MSRYLHWSYEDVMSMDHLERQGWVGEVRRMNEHINELSKRS